MTIVNWCHAASVKLRQLERNVSRNDIECPGDMILFNCSVQSNSENVQLTWEVTFPDQTTLNITYYNASGITVHDLGLGSSTSLTEYIEDHYIESTITFTVIQTVQLNGSQLECRSSDLDSETLDVPVNTSSELANDDWRVCAVFPPPPPPPPRQFTLRCHNQVITSCLNASISPMGSDLRFGVPILFA